MVKEFSIDECRMNPLLCFSSEQSGLAEIDKITELQKDFVMCELWKFASWEFEFVANASI